jgi:3',5'-cyclic AMP phosphodiesterase CpdA
MTPPNETLADAAQPSAAQPSAAQPNAAKPDSAQTFAQLSDLHLSSLEGVAGSQLLSKRLLGYISWRRKRRHEHRAEVLEALRQDLRERQLDQLLITGDLTHIGLPTEFMQAAHWLRETGSPTDIALVPGNHDACVAQSWELGYSHWQPYMDSDPGLPRSFPSLRRRNAIAFIGVSTACPTPPLMATGSAGEPQLQRLRALLRSTREEGLCRVIYLHHSPVPGSDKWRKRLTDAPELNQLIAEEGAELVLHGHGHRAQQHWIESAHGRVPVLAVPSASALGLHGADVAQYNSYRVSGTQTGWEILVESYGYQSAEQRFTLEKTETLPLPRSAA